MGINLCIQERNKDSEPEYVDHPNWDSIRCANDLEFKKMIDQRKVEWHPHPEGRYMRMFRPLNIDELRKKVEETNWLNKSRYLKLLDIVELDHEKKMVAGF